MVLQCKKGKYFATGEVFPLDIGLLMGAIISGQARRGDTTCVVFHCGRGILPGWDWEVKIISMEFCQWKMPP